MKFIKNLKKIITLLLTVVIIVSGKTNIYAMNSIQSKNESSYSLYENLRQQGVLGSDITYSYWSQLQKEAILLEKELESSHNFSKVYDSTQVSINSSSEYTMKAGDILITNATSSSGLTGHAAMAVTAVQILHIEGAGKTPSTLGLESWHNKYTNSSSSSWTKIYRHEDSNVATAAATWERNAYRGSSATYEINMDLASTSKTYCSKMVWQAYYYGPSTPEANGPTVGVRLPYDLPSIIHDLTLQNTF